MKIAILSFAHVHAATYIRLLRDRTDIDLITTDPDGDPGSPSRGKHLAKTLDVPYVDSYDEVLAEAPQAVIITSENARHRPLVERAAAVGAHILCEKPLATTAEDAEAMIDACESAGVSLMTAYPVRFHPAFTNLQLTVASGALGRLLTIHGVNNSSNPALQESWFADRALSGGGAIMDHTVHIADLVDVLLGGEQPTHIYAQANRLLTQDARPTDVETAALITLTYPSGLVTTIDCSWSHPPTHPTWGGLTLTCIGHKGVATFDAFPPLLRGYDTQRAQTRWKPGATDVDATMLEAFLTAARTGQRAHPDGQSGLRTLKIVLAAYQSLSYNQQVALTP